LNRRVKVTWETELEEQGPANAHDDPEIVPRHQRTRYRKRGERAICEAVEQIGCTLDWFAEKQPDAEEWDNLDGATTSLLEQSAKCKFCRQGRRNGDCLLPWEDADF
jgi:hypothetical protein